jgi:hypothetical protein
MLRFWYSDIDCTSFGLLPEVALLLGVEKEIGSHLLLNDFGG